MTTTTVNSEEQTYDAKGIILESIGLQNYKGDVFDLTEFCTGFVVYEDMFKNSMSMEVAIVDAVGLIERYPIIGDEAIYVKFITPSYENSVEVNMQVVGIGGKKKLNDTTVRYTLECVSQEYVNNLSRTADKAYIGLPVSTMVEDVYNLIKRGYKPKELVVDPSIGNHTFIAPDTEPMEFIKFLEKEAIAGNQSANYVFWEDKDQFNFRTLNRMYRQEPKFEFYYIQHDVETTNATQLSEKIDPSQKVLALTVARELDTLRLTELGYYDNSVAAIDPILKSYRDTGYTHEQNFDLVDHLGKDGKGKGNKSISENSFKKNYYGASRSKYFFSRISDGNYYQESYLEGRIGPDDGHDYYPSRRWITENKRMAISSGLNYLQLDIDIPGNSDIKTGDVVDLFVPADTSEEELLASFNRRYGDSVGRAKFLVTRVAHIFTASTGEYITSLRLNKDTTANPIVAESDEI